MKVNWTTEWPTQRGRYWFYGIRYRDCEERELFTVRVMITGNGSPVYVCEGVFLYKQEGAEGQFAPLVEPELPA